ncbi:MAG: BREX system serine/threonine kinase PglW [Polyangiaceae bacterium]|nr:BREX system serine/threonine kinase PglW [Polyangiaceae bacterium]
MPLSNARKVVVGESPYAHEREALEFAYAALPDSDPFHVWALTELLEPSTGRLLEVDLLVMGYSALYLIEIKSGPGRYEGDHHEWYRTPPGQARSVYMDGPLSLCNYKAKVLKSRLLSKMNYPAKCPYVEALVFLSATDLDLRLKADGMIRVVTRKDLAAAVQFHKFPGAPDNYRNDKIDRPTMHDVAQALSALGIRARKGRAVAGSYELGELLVDGAGYQDRVATHRHKNFSTRARVYLVPQQASVDRRMQLRRAAERESTLLWDVREHPHVLQLSDYVSDAPLGPTVIFGNFAGGVPLDAFMRQNPTLPFEERLTMVEQVGRALSHCHRKSIVHGAVSPQSVLVRRHPDTNEIDTRLFNFQLGAGGGVDFTQHWSALALEDWAVYQAPELRENPLSRSTQSDLFSLGALAYFVFTGRAPAERAEELDRRLERSRYLDPRTVDDGVSPKIAEVFTFATDVAPVNRADDVDEWLEILLDAATAPDEASTPEEVDPLTATKDARLGDFQVVKLLGTGATARVLRVRRLKDEREFALKIALDSTHDERIADEAIVLSNLDRDKHARIVALHGQPTLKGRKCLLLSLAGELTLQQKIARFGPVSLDEASRYGDDLLQAIEHLEEHQVLHRDIKPANLGVGSTTKQADHLTLFDFSLSRLPISNVQVGTAVYRDPYLRSEGRNGWDFAADRWSAAVTLHEMIAGSRPTFAGGSAIDPDAKLVLAAERFDANVRDDLVRFFEQAFARKATDRFASAHDMRLAWLSVVGAPARSLRPKIAATPPPPLQTPAEVSPPVLPAPAADLPIVQADDSPGESVLTEEQIAQIDPDTPVATLPLSNRARNALDRAGLTRMRDLPGLSPNRLSAIRGVGRHVAKEIFHLRDTWMHVRTLTETPLAPFFPGYGGEDRPVGTLGLNPALSDALVDSGLPTLRALAFTPETQVKNLAERHRFDPLQLRTALADENERANQRAHPTTLEGWVEALLPQKKGKKDRHLVRALLGLDAPFQGRLDVTVREVATAENKTLPAVYIAQSKAREDWASHKALSELRERLTTLVESAGGAAHLVTLSEELARTLPHGTDVSPALVLAKAAALFRIVAETDKDTPTGLRWLRLNDRDPWMFLSEEYARWVRALGAAADALAKRPTLASPGEARRVFDEIVANTPLATAKDERLFALATAASANAACSARMEIYPRGLEARRAVELCAATFKGGVTEVDVKSRVALRYPHAAPLPTRPDLDALLAPIGFTWVASTNQFERPEEQNATSLQTSTISSLIRARTALPTQPRAMDADAIDARQFDERLKHALEMNAFRVLGVRADRARQAALDLQERLGADLLALDLELAREVETQRKKANIPSDDVVFSADREGPTGPHWSKLKKLVSLAADALLPRLCTHPRPLLLVQPGPIARYNLVDFVTRLVSTASKRETQPLFLLVPVHDTLAVPRIEGTFTIPGILPGQTLWVSAAWMSNRHNAAA